jgi:CRP-like cAMP-binding protein
MVTAALAVFAWAAATGWMLSWISLPPPEGATLWGRLWQAGAALLLLGWTVWLVVRSTSLVVSALSLRTPTGLLAIEPSDALRQAWLEQNPLNRHLPVLEKARWAWHMAPPGSVLIRQGAEERHFLWLARGSADVLARSPGGDPILVAALRGGCGVGEVALLEGGRRTADVIAREACVVATLEREEFERITDTEARGRFRELVQASQTLARAPALWGLAPDDRASWLSRGSRRVHRAGEVLMRQGDPGRWMGLVVEGRVLVERDGVRVAELGPDDVFGEMAFLDHAPRRATLTAQEPVLCWSWDADFLDRAIGTGELKESLARLAGERSG